VDCAILDLNRLPKLSELPTADFVNVTVYSSHWGTDITTATALTTSKDAEGLVPPFDPTNVRIEIWITKVEELAAIDNWNDRTKAHFALSKLSGIAATWYQGLQLINFTWPEWKFLLQTNSPTRRNFFD